MGVLLIESERWLDDVIKRAITTGLRRVAVDVGANSGEWSQMLAKHFDFVVAVEPDARCDLSHLPDNVIVLQGTVLGDTHGVQRDFHFRPSPAQNSLLASHPLPNSAPDVSVEKTVSLPMTTLDELLRTFSGAIDFVKIDVEGAEREVLAGATAPSWSQARWIIESHNTTSEIGVELSRIGVTDVTLVSHPDQRAADSGHGWVYAHGLPLTSEGSCGLPDPEFGEHYESLLTSGRETATSSSVVFVACARDCGERLQANLAEIDEMAAQFSRSAVIVFENDSTDGTKETLSQWAGTRENKVVISEDNNRPHLHGFEPARTAALAEYRTRCQREVSERYPDYDFVCVIDLDVEGGYAGMLTALPLLRSIPNAAGMASVSVMFWDGQLIGYDQWAFRMHGWGARFDGWFRDFLPPRGAPPVEVFSAFGGMCVYGMRAYVSGTYDGNDCEHVPFHRSLNGRMFINPSQRVLVMR